MNKNRIYMTILVAVLLAIIIYVSNGMLNAGKEEEYYTVSVILDNSSSDRWNAFKEGLEQGAEEHHIHLNVVSTGKMSGMNEEYTLIGRELENGADGLIVELWGEDEEGIFAGTTVSKPVVLVENNVQSANLYTTVAPDYFKLGMAIGKAVLDGEADRNLRVGVLAGKKEKNSLQQCLKGLEKALESTEVSVDWVLRGEEVLGNYEMKGYLETHPVDVLVTLDNEETEWAVDFLLENEELPIHLYGEGRSEKAVYYLDKGLIETLVVPNEFYMGYRSVELLARMIGYHVADTEQDEVEYLVVTRDNLYEKDVEKVLFPTVR